MFSKTLLKKNVKIITDSYLIGPTTNHALDEIEKHLEIEEILHPLAIKGIEASIMLFME
jgi:hypothetical protein